MQASQIFLSGSVVKKNPPANGGDVGSVPGSGRSPGEGHGNPFLYYCLGNPMDRGVWWATVHGVQTIYRMIGKSNRIMYVKMYCKLLAGL